jgi:Flp pilus assembly pilin Flp
MDNVGSSEERPTRRQKGVTTVEYVIMLVLIALAVAIGAPYVSSSIVGVFGKTSSVLNTY